MPIIIINTDSIGQIVKVGDYVIYPQAYHRGMKIGTIKGFTSKGNPQLNEEYYAPQKGFVKITPDQIQGKALRKRLNLD